MVPDLSVLRAEHPVVLRWGVKESQRAACAEQIAFDPSAADGSPDRVRCTAPGRVAGLKAPGQGSPMNEAANARNSSWPGVRGAPTEQAAQARRLGVTPAMARWADL